MFDGEEVTYYPWIQPLSESAVGWCAPVAALMNYVLFALAVVYGLKKKEWSVKGIRNIALIAGTLAVLPNLIRSDVMVVPNVFGAITLFADALVAHILVKDLAKGEKTDSPRKTRHL